MSREIKFRGKRIGKQEWVNGYVARAKESNDNGIVKSYYFNALDEMCWVYECVVIADTVGQYIGAPDKNGKEIYEGDIVKQFADCTELGKSLYFFYVIEWSEEYCAFIGREIYSNETYLMPDLEDIEVIGNVYENADLLKEVE